MQLLHRALLVPLLSATLSGSDGLAHARQAQTLLGSGVWSRVLRIENTNPKSRYGRTVYAMVFEMKGVLWFYTDADGTQSLSLYQGRALQDEGDLGPLLVAIDSGFTEWTAIQDDGPLPERAPRLPNGCFIESLALLRSRLRRGAATADPKLLSYYVQTARGLRGHTVLQFRTERGIEIIDPDRPERVAPVRLKAAEDAKSVIDRLRGDVTRARWIALDGWAAVEAPSFTSMPTVQKARS